MQGGERASWPKSWTIRSKFTIPNKQNNRVYAHNKKLLTFCWLLPKWGFRHHILPTKYSLEILLRRATSSRIYSVSLSLIPYLRVSVGVIWDQLSHHALNVDVACVGKIGWSNRYCFCIWLCVSSLPHPWNSLLVAKVVQNIYSSQFIAHRFGTGFSHLLGNRSGRAEKMGAIFKTRQS